MSFTVLCLRINDMKSVFVIGAGRWGTFIATYLHSLGHRVSIYGRQNSERMMKLIETGKNDLIEIPQGVTLTTDITGASGADIIIISIGSQGLRALMTELSSLSLKEKTVVLCMKGIEIESGKRLSEIAEELLDTSCKVAVWLGPGHVQDFTRGRPNCMVIDSSSDDVKHELVELFSSNLIRFYYGGDLVGNEIGAAAKNVMGIAAGILDGLGLSSLKGALMARGPREISRLAEAMGGKAMSIYGLCHLGDYEATVFSPYSHNRAYGESLVTHKEFSGLAEGYYTVKALLSLGEKYSVELPICRAVYAVAYLGACAETEMKSLFTRSLKYEFDS